MKRFPPHKVIIFNMTKSLVKILFLYLIVVTGNITWASTWTNSPGFTRNSGATIICPASADLLVDGQSGDAMKAICDFKPGPGNTVPTTGEYYITMYATRYPNDGSAGSRLATVFSARFNLTANVQLDTVNLNLALGSGYSNITKSYSYVCYALWDTHNHTYIFNNTPQGCKHVDDPTPLPPGPNFVMCSFNDGKALDVSLGEVERSTIGAVPGTIPAIEKPLNVTCTGDGQANFSVKFQYTPISIAGNEYIVSSANGLSVAMSLNDTIVNTSTTYNRTYGVGTQTEMLAFEPMRDPTVKYTDIPTGAFTASAVMIITQE